jgi:transposase InsO family protein
MDTRADLPRSKGELIAENALLRQQLLVLRRSVTRVHCTPTDRTLLVLLASRVRAWRQALLIVQPATLLRWHRQGFRLFWRWTSRATTPTARPKVRQETITLIKEMAAANRLWGAERIRGELLKLGIRVAKTTVQRYMRQARPRPRAGQTWSAFLRTHAADIWACDFLPVTDLLFRQLYAFFIVELATRRVLHVAVTRHPTDAWVAQQLREATPFGTHPTYLIRDNDSRYGPAFARVAEASGITVIQTAYRAPLMNAICERFLGSVRRECLDHLLIRARPTSGAPCGPMSTTLTRSGPTRASPSGFLHQERQGRPTASPADASRPSRCCVACIMRTGVSPDQYARTARMREAANTADGKGSSDTSPAAYSTQDRCV